MPAAPLSRHLSASQAVLLIIAGSTLIRIWIAAVTGLGFDESYMVGNARQFLAGYVDHPPLHVWITGVAVFLGGSEASIVVRLPFILLFAGSTWLMYRLTSRLFGESAGLWAVIAFNLAPVFSLADATWVLPDGPLIFFLLAAANVVARILFEEPAEKHATLLWIAAGVLGGLALLSKFTAAFFFAAVFAYLLTVPSARRRLATPGPWLGAAAALLVLSPALIWNAGHGFTGILFQSGRLAQPELRLDRLALEIGGGLLYLTPWLAVPFAISLVSALLRGRSDWRGWYLALAAIGPIAAFIVAALFARTLPHWSMPGWLFAIPLFGRDAVSLALRRPQFARGYMTAVAIVFAALLAAFAFQAIRGGLVPHAIVAANPASDPTTDLIDWSPLADRLAAERLLGPDLVVAAPVWFAAGKVSYALGPDVPVLCLCGNPQQFAYRTDQAAYEGRDVLVVVPNRRYDDDVVRYFDRLERLPPVEIMRGGETVLTLDLRLGRNLQFP